MGSGASISRSSDAEEQTDQLDDEYTHKVPDESLPRRAKGENFATAALRSVGSFGLTKKQVTNRRLFQTVSLPCAYEENDLWRLLKESKDRCAKKESENRRLRGELRLLQATCVELKNEKNEAIEAKEQILQRAGVFEEERDTVKRQFKIYRETKEREIQDLLLAKRKLEAELYHHGNQDSLDSVGNVMTAGWWTMSLEREPSMDSLSTSLALRGPEFNHSLTERDGPFTNISRDDWNAVIPSVRQPVSTSLQTACLKHTIIMYVSSPSGTEKELQLLKQVHLPKLEYLCEGFDRFLVMVHFSDRSKHTGEEEFLRELQTRLDQVNQSRAFVAFLGMSCDRFTHEEYRQAAPDKAIFCFRSPNWNGCFPSVKDNIDLTEQIKAEVQKTEPEKLLDNYHSPEEGAHWAYEQLHNYLMEDFGLENKDNIHESAEFAVCSNTEWYVVEDAAQMEALKQAASVTQEIHLSKYYSDLNEHVSCAGPRPPMVVFGNEGSGKSLLLAKWIALEQNSMSGRLVLYHFVGPMSSCRTCVPGRMMQRLMLQLMCQIMSPTLSCDFVNMKEEFPRLLEKVASKSHGGIAIVIDSADKLLQESSSHMQWLLDPLPVNVRVILSVTGPSCPQIWRSWPSLIISSLDPQRSKELFLSSWKNNSDKYEEALQEQVMTLFSSCSSDVISNPRFITLLAAAAGRCKNSNAVVRCCTVCFSQKSVTDLACHMLEQIEAEFLPDTAGVLLRQKGTLIVDFMMTFLCKRSRLKYLNLTFLGERDFTLVQLQIMLYIVISRCGVNEGELFHLLSIDWSTWLPLTAALHQRHILTTRLGLIMFFNDQIREAVLCKYDIDVTSAEAEGIRSEFVDFLKGKQRSGCVTRRLVHELPWQLIMLGQRDELRTCMLDARVFKTLFENGCVPELLHYWRYVEVDQSSLAHIYADVIKQMERENKSPVVVADLHELVGRFLKSVGLLSQAPPFLQKALEIREAALDPDHQLVAQSLHHLAELYAQSGKFSASESFYKQSIEIKENALGLDHPSLEMDLWGLAVLYKKNNKHNVAEALHRRFVAIRQNSSIITGHKTLRRITLHVEELAQGPPSPEVARSLNELGVLNFLQKNHESSKSFFLRSLQMRKSVLGTEHPDVAQSLHNLAGLYNDQKIYNEAESLYTQALKIRSKSFPPHHACVVSTVKHLALLYKKQGKYGEAEPLYKQALEVRQKLFGSSHPSVATELNNLAVVLCLQKKHAEALPLYERGLKIYEETLGTSHPRVAETLVNLAKLHFDQENPEYAATLYKQAGDLRDSHNSTQAFCRRSSFGVQSAVHISARQRPAPTAQARDSVISL